MAARRGGPTRLTAGRRMDLRDVAHDALAYASLRARQNHWTSSAYEFGDLSVAIRIDGSGATRQLLRMIEARRSAATGEAILIDVVGGSLGEHDRLLPPVDRRGAPVLRSNRDIYYLWLNEAGGYLTVIDRRNRRGLVWFTAPERIASWHIARPFLHAIKGLSLQSQWTPIHAAAVALDGAGILIVGKSGAGKTSLAVGCALAGWDYLGDDAVIVRADPATVGALYASARLRADTFDLFPRAMAASLGISDDAGELKAEVDMALLRPLGRPEAAIRAIVVPRRTDEAMLRFEPISRPDVLHRLMAAAHQSLMGDEAPAFAKLAGLVSSVPSYFFYPGRDPAAAPAAFARLIDGKTGA
jgi:hypothetical protein